MSANQYGYRIGHSTTIDATWKPKKLATSAIKKRPFGAVVSLDIQNAFNLVLWTRIMQGLENAKMLVYLLSIIWDYFQDQMVLVQTASNMIRKK